MEPLFVVTCEEPEGTVDRAVYPFIFTPENAVKFWESARQFPMLFNDIPTGDPATFFDAYFKYDELRQQADAAGLLWVVDDFVGMYALTDIYHPSDANVHFTFFDRRFKGRGELTRRMIKFVFDTYGFERLSASIPATASKVTLRFVSDELGFILEGRKRKAMTYKEEKCDVLLYGILPEDIEKWEEQRLRRLAVDKQPHLLTSGSPS